MDTQRQATQPGSFINDSEQRPRTAEPYDATNPASFTASHSAARQPATYSSDANTRTHGLSTTSYGAGVPGSYPLQSTSISAAPREPELPRFSNATAPTAADAPSEAATSFYTARGGSVIPPQPASSNWRVQSTPLSSHAARIRRPQPPSSSKQLEKIREELETPTGQHSEGSRDRRIPNESHKGSEERL
ncbi:hypothetical protein PTTG_08839 [Puccinia triticina 1-1 BBBD Race 1]|uniref:Uncharacterized protein n=1 Tax=Puccinia triticina (isolate 1-1 / race 1 (BBBD)) TaxID=630390 RepID=A0A180G485_PUCT1|nr:hypothetical protein PTTG_08839 [Puccinia triticina 1-1 BBBD Race 1]